MKLICGLGNPGFRYRKTRHNIGFMVLDNIAAGAKIRMRKRYFNSLSGKGRIGGEEVMLIKPLTFMNLSGRAVAEAIDREDVSLKDLLIIMDDADLPLGRIRLKERGSSGGHRGLRSVIEELGVEEFPRLRVGIGNTALGLSGYVLTPFKKSEKKALKDAIERSVLCVRTWITEGAQHAMNRFNT